MSIQFNFFAVKEDELLIAREALDVFGNLYWLPERSIFVEMVPRRIVEPLDLTSGSPADQCYLFQEAALDSIVIKSIHNNMYCTKFREFSCLEYIPSRILEDGTLHIGRFAYFYADDICFRRRVDKFFRRLHGISRRLPNRSRCRIFENAELSAITLKGWGET